MSDCFLVTVEVIVLDTEERQAVETKLHHFTNSASSEMRIMKHGISDSTCIHLFSKCGSGNKDIFIGATIGLQYYMRCVHFDGCDAIEQLGRVCTLTGSGAARGHG